jgi:hypothetical protein
MTKQRSCRGGDRMQHNPQTVVFERLTLPVFLPGSVELNNPTDCALSNLAIVSSRVGGTGIGPVHLARSSRLKRTRRCHVRVYAAVCSLSWQIRGAFHGDQITRRRTVSGTLATPGVFKNCGQGRFFDDVDQPVRDLTSIDLDCGAVQKGCAPSQQKLAPTISRTYKATSVVRYCSANRAKLSGSRSVQRDLLVSEDDDRIQLRACAADRVLVPNQSAQPAPLARRRRMSASGRRPRCHPFAASRCP